MIIKPKYYGPSIPSTYAVALTAAASGSNGITVADDDDIDFGTGDFFLHWEGSLPDWTPASGLALLRKAVNSATPGILLNLDNSPPGMMLLQMYAGTGVTNVDANSGFAVGATDGAIQKLTIVVTRESVSVAGAVNFYAGGLALGTPVSITAGAPFSVSNALPIYISGTSSTRTASNNVSCIVGNFAPTAAEVLDLCTNGIPESWKWGSQAAVYASNFSAGVDSWLVSGVGTLAGNVDAVSDGSVSKDNCLRFTSGASTGTKAFYKTSSFVSAKKNGAVMYVYVPAGQSYIDGFRVYADSNSGTLVYNGAGQNGSWIEIDVSFVPVGTALVVYCYDGTSVSINALGSGEIVYVVGVETKKLGATMALLPNSIPTSGATAWDDSSGNTGGGTLPAAGATKVTIRK